MSNILRGLQEGYFSRDEEEQQRAMDTRRSSDLSRERNVGLDEPDEMPVAQPETRNGVYEYNVPAGQEKMAQELGLEFHKGHWFSRTPFQRADLFFGRPQFHEIPSKNVEEAEQVDSPKYQSAVQALKQMAQQGERKTVWDPVRRVYKTVPVQKKEEGVAESVNDTIYPNAEVIKSKNGKPVGEIYQDGNSWGAFHYRADRGYEFLDSREDAIEALKDLHQETGRSRPDYTIKGVAEDSLNEFAVDGFGDSGDKRSKLLASVGRLLDSGNKVDWQVPGQMGHVTQVKPDGITMKKWKQPHSRMSFFLPMYDDSRDNKYTIKMVAPKHYAVVSAEQGVAEADQLQGTPVVSLSDLTDKDYKKNKYGQTVPKKLKQDDPRVKFHKDEKKGVAEGDYPDGSSIKTPGAEEWKQQYQQAVMAVKNAKTQQEYEAASDRAGRIKDLLASKGIQVGPVLGQQGVAEGSDIPHWRVEQSEATGRYYVVTGYTSKSRRVWKSKQGAGDFSKRADAEAKAQELNQGVAEADITRRGFLRGLGAAALGAAAGNVLAGSNDPGFIRKVQDKHIEMAEKNPRYEKEHAALQLPMARGITGNALEMNKRWAEKTAELLAKYGVTINEGVAEGSMPYPHGKPEAGDKIIWYHSNHYPELEGEVVGWKDGHLIVKSIDPSPRNTEKTVATYRVPKNNIMSVKKQGVAEDMEDKKAEWYEHNGIRFKVEVDDRGLAIDAYNIDGDTEEGSEIGAADFFFTSTGELDPAALWVDDDYRNKGIAKSMYDFLKGKGYTVIRSEDQTPAGKAFWDKHRGEGVNVWEQDISEDINFEESFNMKINEINEDWQKVNRKDKTSGMSKKAVKAYRRENPGSKLQTAVTTKPSKLKKGSKSAKRRKSFCARMKGMKKSRTSAKTARDPNSNINKALRRWNCESIEQMQELIMIAESKIAEAKNAKQQAAIAIAKKAKMNEAHDSCHVCGQTPCNCTHSSSIMKGIKK